MSILSPNRVLVAHELHLKPMSVTIRRPAAGYPTRRLKVEEIGYENLDGCRYGLSWLHNLLRKSELLVENKQ
jgi:hypothetical protein